MPMMPASRVGDMHVCPMVTGIVPHVGGPVLPPCAVTVLTGGSPQARVKDMCTCVGPPDTIVTGAWTTLVSGSPAARIMDMTAHGGMLVLGCFTVLIGDGGASGPGSPGGPGSGYKGGGGESGGGGSSDSWDDAANTSTDPANPAPQGQGNAQAALPTGAVQVPPDMLKKSPTLSKQLDDLKKDGWVIEYGQAGGGSFADRSAKKITIDPNDSKSEAKLTQTVSHEVGHAKYTGQKDSSSRAAYVTSSLADEGAATMNNVTVQREINANGGPDIGIAGNPNNAAGYNRIMDRYATDGDAAAAQRDIGQVFGDGERTSNTGQTYNEYYGSAYDRANPPQH